MIRFEWIPKKVLMKTKSSTDPHFIISVSFMPWIVCKVFNQKFWCRNLVFTITGYTRIRKFHYKLSRKQKLFARKKFKTFSHFHKIIFTLIQRRKSKFPWIVQSSSKLTIHEKYILCGKRRSVHYIKNSPVFNRLE